MSTCQTTGRVSVRGKFLFQMYLGVWELVKISCADVLLRTTRVRGIPQQSAVLRKYPPWKPDSISVWKWSYSVKEMMTRDNNLSRLFPKYYSLLTVLWSLTSAWWLFQRNLPAANLCTCIIASVKLIRLFVSNVAHCFNILAQDVQQIVCYCVFGQWSEKYIPGYWQGNSDPV